MRKSALALSLVIGSTSALADSWEGTLQGKEPAAQQRIRLLCSGQARQNVYGTIDGVSSLAVLSDGEAIAGANFSSESGGYSNTNIPYIYLRMGLKEVEFDARLESGRRLENQPVAVFDTRSRTIRFTASYQAEVEIVFSDATTPEDKKMDIYGRRIQVRLASTKQMLGERTEFYWFHRSPPRKRVMLRGALCPGFTFAHQTLPTDFIGEIVNPHTYPCMATYIRNSTTAKELSSREFLAAGNVRERIKTWSKAKEAREAALLDALNLCQANYFAGPEPSGSSITWRTTAPK